MNPRIEGLLNRWLDGELDPPEAEAVQRMLIDRPEVRQAYYELLMVDQMLAEHGKEFSHGEEIIEQLADEIESDRVRSFPNTRYLAIAAIVLLTLFSTFLLFRKGATASSELAGSRGPSITGSTDSRLTVAQRQDNSRWAVGEVLRLERGSAVLQLKPLATANIEGPAAIELVDAWGNIRLLEGMGSFSVGETGSSLDVHVPGGVIRNLDSRFTAEVFSDGIANVRVESGFLEIRPRGASEPIYLKKGEALRLESNGGSEPIRLPNQHFRSGLPQQMALFQDDFHTDEGLPLDQHRPTIGLSWEAISETNPTIIRNQVLDTSTGARNLLARLSPHEASGSRSVYIFTFHLVPPTMIDDKVNRKGGVETISLVDASGKEFLTVFATAVNSHRWQLRDDYSKAVTALTPVCSLWTHSLTLCYGMDGRATLHDGSTAQAPVIAELKIASPSQVMGIQIGNRDGGDIAFSSIETALLQAAPAEP
ncbi:MAG: hypothetical protein ABIS50_11250 [Luteolibacter sp.]|uniref:anti-sigma factor family protein n=1 Tax=Luteolibacter sp. TaxID=1962973 RepID=UPI00326704BE